MEPQRPIGSASVTNFSIDAIMASAHMDKMERGDKKTSFHQPAKQTHRIRQKNFHCFYCKTSFSNNGQLRNHVRIHTGERPFKCNRSDCQKSFTRNEELTRHKRIHTGLKPYACCRCEQKFGRKDHLQKHLKIHDKLPKIRTKTKRPNSPNSLANSTPPPNSTPAPAPRSYTKRKQSDQQSTSDKPSSVNHRHKLAKKFPRVECHGRDTQIANKAPLVTPCAPFPYPRVTSSEKMSSYNRHTLTSSVASTRSPPQLDNRILCIEPKSNLLPINPFDQHQSGLLANQQQQQIQPNTSQIQTSDSNTNKKFLPAHDHSPTLLLNQNLISPPIPPASFVHQMSSHPIGGAGSTQAPLLPAPNEASTTSSLLFHATQFMAANSVAAQFLAAQKQHETNPPTYGLSMSNWINNLLALSTGNMTTMHYPSLR